MVNYIQIISSVLALVCCVWQAMRIAQLEAIVDTLQSIEITVSTTKDDDEADETV